MEKKDDPVAREQMSITVNIQVQSILSKLNTGKLKNFFRTSKQQTGKIVCLTAGSIFPLPTAMVSQALNEFRSSRHITKKQALYVGVALGLVAYTAWMLHKGNTPSSTESYGADSQSVECCTYPASFPNETDIPVLRPNQIGNSSSMPTVVVLTS